MKTPKGMSKAEWDARVDLACAFQLFALFGWTDMIKTHLSVRVPGVENQFLTNPYGLLFEDITASSLVKVGDKGELLSKSNYSIHPTAIVIHGGIHNAHPAFGCVLHLHTVAGVAVSMQKNGLLPACQHALTTLFQVRYHDFEGVASGEAERESLLRDLGDGGILILRNHGTLTVGPTVAEAFYRMYRLERACQYQIAALSGGAEFYPIPKADQEKTIEQGRRAYTGEAAKEKSELVWAGLKRKLKRERIIYAI